MIGVLDSGVGGLSIYREIKKRYPEAEVIYLADKAKFPYGEKSEAELLDIVSTAVRTLLAIGVDIVVIACNSATVTTIEALRSELTVPLVGIEPAIKQAAKITKNGKIGVLATHRTTEVHDGESLAPDCTLCKSHHEALVSMIENDFASIDDMVLEQAMKPFVDAGVDTVVLGCTHYSFIKSRLESMYPNMTFLDPTVAVVNRLEVVIKENNIEITTGDDIFLCSADRQGFEKSLKDLLGIKNADIREI